MSTDTIKFFTKYFYLDVINAFVHYRRKTKDRYTDYKLTPLNKDHSIRVAIKKPYEGSKDLLLFITVDIPKLLYGSSIYEVTDEDFPKACVLIEDALIKKGIHLTLPLSDCQVSRIDYCTNIIVDPDKLGLYIQAFGEYAKGRYRKRFYIKNGYETILLYNRSFSFTIYNKIRCEKEEHKRDHGNHPENMLRIEFRLKNSNAIHRKLDIPYLTFRDVFRQDISSYLIWKEFNSLIEGLPSHPFLTIIPEGKVSMRRKPMVAFRSVEDTLRVLDYDWCIYTKRAVKSGEQKYNQANRTTNSLRSQYAKAYPQKIALIHELRSLLEEKIDRLLSLHEYEKAN